MRALIPQLLELLFSHTPMLLIHLARITALVRTPVPKPEEAVYTCAYANHA